MHVKFGLKSPNHLGKMSENLRGDFLTHTVDHRPAVTLIAKIRQMALKIKLLNLV